MPAPHTTPSTASVATAAPSPTTTPRTTRSGRAIQQPSQLQHVIGIGKGSPATYSASAVQNPVYGAVEGGRSSPAANGMWGEQRTNPTPANLLADVSTGTTYNISPTHEMAHPQRRMNEHEVAMMAGNRSMGAPTPTSTSSYGGGGKDEGGYGSTLGARRGSEYEGTDDSFGGGMMGAGGLDDAGLQGHVSPDYGLDGEDYNGGHDGHEAGEDAGERDGPEGSQTRDQFKMMSEEGEAHEGHEQSGTWTETKTKAGKERKRLPLACIMCRRKKIRCSGEKPACKHCLRSRIPCVYRQTARKTVPRTDYMTMLDRRLKRMEERLLKSVPKEEINAILANTGRSVVKPAITAAGKKRSAEMAFEDDITSWAQTAPYLKQQRNTDGARTSVPPPLRDPTVDSDDGSHALPSKELQEHLAEVFFDYVYGQPYFLLHKPSFMRRLKGGTAPPILVLAICAVSARFSKHPAVQHERPFSAGESFAAEARRQLLKNFDTANITNLTVCILLGLHEFGTCHGGRSWAFGGMATRMAHALQLHKEADQDPMAKVHPLMRPDYLHEGGHMGGYMSFIDKEIRRRCFWACFVMDRFNSSGTERPCIINESEVEIQLPVHDRNLQLDVQAITEQLDGGVKDTSELPEEEKVAVAAENMGIGAYIVRAVAMYGRVVKYLNQGGKEKDAREMWDSDSHFAELRSELQHFIVDLPEAFQYTQANILAHDADRRLAQLIFLHIAYQQVRLFLHRSASNMAGSNQHGPSIVPQEFAVSAREVALEAATKIAEILQEGQERGAHVVAPFTGYCAFNASLIHLVRMFDSRPAIQMEAKKHMETCLKFLLQMRQYWGLFHPITDNLKLLYKKFAESYSRGTNLAAHREISRMLQYGDWFLKYPQGFPPEDLEDDPAKGRVAGDVRSPSEDAALSHRPDLQTADEFFARLGPHRQTPLLVGAVKHAENFMQSPSDTRSSPGHVQSPMTHAGTSMQSPPMHTPPMATNTPALIQKPAKRPRSIDTHKASHVRQTSMPQQSSSAYAGNFGPQETPSQLTSPLSARLPGMPTTSAARFSSYAPQVLTPQNLAAQGGVHFNHHQQPPQHPVSQGQTSQPPFLYDPSLIAALSTGLWQGFDQPMNTADISGFPEHQVGSSAWFMPFNSVPPDFETAHVGLNALGMLAANSGVGGVSGTAAESGGSLSAVTAAAERPGSSTSAAGVPAGGIAGYHGGGGRQQQQR